MYLRPVDELYHYGVKGMKWGVRRTPAQLGNKNSKSQSDVKRTSSRSNIRKSIQKGRDFVKRNGKTIALVGVSAGLTAAGLGWVSNTLSAYNIASMDLHNYLIKNNLYRGI